MRIDATDADELSERLGVWQTRLTELDRGPFTGSVQIIRLAPLLILRASFNKSMVQHDWVPEGYIALGRPNHGSAPVSYSGHHVEDGEVFVGGASAESEVVNLGRHHSAALCIQRDVLEREADWIGHATAPASIRGVHLRVPGAAWTTAFLDAINWIAAAVDQYVDAIRIPEVGNTLVDSLLARIDTLGAVGAPVSQDRHMRAQRRRAVTRAREYIECNLTDPIRLSDLSRHARTQARSLEYGFREVLGVSPMAYVRATRLHRARRLLRTTAVRTRSISEIALDCGFWHLSQFSVDYKLLFGESPSVTYHRTEAELPRSERRREVSLRRPAAATMRPAQVNCAAAAVL